MATVHQPSSEILALFDKLILLAEGKVVFHGTLAEALVHFEELGYPCPDQYNPGDHFLFVIETLADRTPLFEKWEQRSKAITLELVTQQEAHADKVMKYPDVLSTSFMTQLSVLTKREMQNKVRDKASLIIRVCTTIFLTTLYALVFLGRGDTSRSDYELRSHFGMVVNLAIAAMFSSAQPVLLTFPLERPVFLREYASNMYSVVPYFISKTLSEVSIDRVFTVVYHAYEWVWGGGGGGGK
jgi:hypothetical protein